MCEINPKNVLISKKIFGKDANISCSNFLEEPQKWSRHFNGVNHFDIIFGNPPYNENGTGKGGGVLWKDFVWKSFDILKDAGCLSFVHPTGWRKPAGEHKSAGDIWAEFKKHNLIFLKISDKKIPNFPRVDFYVVQKNTQQQDTYLVNEFESHEFKGYLDLYHLPFIPHFINPTIISLLKKIFSKPGNKFNIIYDQSFKPNKDETSMIGTPHAHFFDTSTQEYVLRYKKYKKETPEYLHQRKIVMTYSNGKKKGLLYPKYYSGHSPLGTTRNTMYQLLDSEDEPKVLMSVLDSDLIKFILKITQFSEPPNYKNEFKILNMIAKPTTTHFETQSDISKYYGLNKIEGRLIFDTCIDLRTTQKKRIHEIKGGFHKKTNTRKRNTRKKI
jgi:hypothetical protein